MPGAHHTTHHGAAAACSWAGDSADAAARGTRGTGRRDRRPPPPRRGRQVLAPEARLAGASALSAWLGQARPASAALPAPDRPPQRPRGPGPRRLTWPPSADRDVVPASRRARRASPPHPAATDAPPRLQEVFGSISAAVLAQGGGHPRPHRDSPVPPPPPHRAGRMGMASRCGSTGVTQHGMQCTTDSTGCGTGNSAQGAMMPRCTDGTLHGARGARHSTQCAAVRGPPCTTPTGTWHSTQCTAGDNKQCTVRSAPGLGRLVPLHRGHQATLFSMGLPVRQPPPMGRPTSTPDLVHGRVSSEET